MSVARPTRREFAASLAVGTVGALAGCAHTSHSATTVAAPAAAPVATPSPPSPAAVADSTKTPDPAAPQADALLSVVVARYGKFIPDAERADVRRGIRGSMRLADRLRAAALTNAVDPFSSFVPAGPVAGGRAR